MRAAAKMAPHAWLVVDLDGTITPTPHSAQGHYLDLTHSPCLPALRRWIARQGRLVVLSTAGRRMLRQVYEVLRPDLAAAAAAATGGAVTGQLVLGGFNGSAVFYTDGAEAALHEDRAFTRAGRYFRTAASAHGNAVDADAVLAATSAHALGDMRPPLIPEAAATSLMQELYERVWLGRILPTAARDPTYVDILSAKYTSLFRETLLPAYERLGPERFASELFTFEAVTTHGRFLTATKDALLDVQRIPPLAPGSQAGGVVQFSVLAVPMARFNDIFDPALLTELAERFDVKVHSQPNSTVVGMQGMEKSAVLRYLLAQRALLPRLAADGQADLPPPYAASFELGNAVAMGDHPESVDAPLTWFPPMPLVSLYPAMPTEEKGTTTTTAVPTLMYNMGGEEIGGAAFLECFVDSDLNDVGAAVAAAFKMATVPVPITTATAE